jgi:hypothetical protein
MENEHVIAGLVRKRAELAGKLEAAHAEVRQLVIDIDAVDATLRMFQPDIDLQEIRPKPLPPRHAAYKGEVSRLVFEALRTAHHPMTTAELAVHVMGARSLNTADKKLLLTISKRVNACLRHHRTRGLVRSETGPGGRALWRSA